MNDYYEDGMAPGTLRIGAWTQDSAASRRHADLHRQEVERMRAQTLEMEPQKVDEGTPAEDGEQATDNQTDDAAPAAG